MSCDGSINCTRLGSPQNYPDGANSPWDAGTAASEPVVSVGPVTITSRPKAGEKKGAKKKFLTIATILSGLASLLTLILVFLRPRRGGDDDKGRGETTTPALATKRGSSSAAIDAPVGSAPPRSASQSIAAIINPRAILPPSPPAPEVTWDLVFHRLLILLPGLHQVLRDFLSREPEIQRIIASAALETWESLPIDLKTRIEGKDTYRLLDSKIARAIAEHETTQTVVSSLIATGPHSSNPANLFDTPLSSDDASLIPATAQAITRSAGTLEGTLKNYKLRRAVLKVFLFEGTQLIMRPFKELLSTFEKWFFDSLALSIVLEMNALIEAASGPEIGQVAARLERLQEITAGRVATQAIDRLYSLYASLLKEVEDRSSVNETAPDIKRSQVDWQRTFVRAKRLIKYSRRMYEQLSDAIASAGALHRYLNNKMTPGLLPGFDLARPHTGIVLLNDLFYYRASEALVALHSPMPNEFPDVIFPRLVGQQLFLFLREVLAQVVGYFEREGEGKRRDLDIKGEMQKRTLVIKVSEPGGDLMRIGRQTWERLQASASTYPGWNLEVDREVSLKIDIDHSGGTCPQSADESEPAPYPEDVANDGVLGHAMTVGALGVFA